MGTETISHFVLHPPYDLSIVKLNNPLMGTETHRCTITHSMRIYERVKLNNPLMGDGNYLPCFANLINAKNVLLN